MDVVAGVDDDCGDLVLSHQYSPTSLAQSRQGAKRVLAQPADRGASDSIGSPSSRRRKKMPPAEQVGVFRQGIGRFEEAGEDERAGLEIDGVHIGGAAGVVAEAAVGVAAG